MIRSFDAPNLLINLSRHKCADLSSLVHKQESIMRSWVIHSSEDSVVGSIEMGIETASPSRSSRYEGAAWETCSASGNESAAEAACSAYGMTQIDEVVVFNTESGRYYCSGV